MKKYTDKEIMVQAKDWFLKMNSKSLTLQGNAEFKAWLAEDPIHRQKYNLMKAIWKGSDVLKDHPLTIREMWKSREMELTGKKHSWFARFNIRRPVWKSAAIFVTMLVMVAGIWLFKTDIDTKTIYLTRTGEQKSVYQPDGTLVHLDAETTITEDFTEKLRRIVLEKGRASFDVFHDKDRPFIVTAGSVVVRALGTKFNVSIGQKGKVIVSVTEGRVQIDDNKKVPLVTKVTSQPLEKRSDNAKKVMTSRLVTQVKPSQKILVSGQQLVVDKKKILPEIAPVNIEKADAWQTGRLYFQKAPLIDVIDDINRYLDNKLVISDKRLENIPITMNFNIKHRKNFVFALEGAIPIRTMTTSNGRILLTMRD